MGAFGSTVLRCWHEFEFRLAQRAAIASCSIGSRASSRCRSRAKHAGVLADRRGAEPLTNTSITAFGRKNGGTRRRRWHNAERPPLPAEDQAAKDEFLEYRCRRDRYRSEREEQRPSPPAVGYVLMCGMTRGTRSRRPRHDVEVPPGPESHHRPRASPGSTVRP